MKKEQKPGDLFFFATAETTVKINKTALAELEKTGMLYNRYGHKLILVDFGK